MTCCGSGAPAATAKQFDEKRAAADLEAYREKGPGKTARMLLDGLAKISITEGSLIDVGSGVGILTFELLRRGVTKATCVDLSSAYIATARAEAKRLPTSTDLQFLVGDFVEIGPTLPSADIVTLDRVVCCYPEFDQLLDQSTRHAERALALAYPKDLLYVRLWTGIENLIRRVRGNPFRSFIHDTTAIASQIEAAGFQRVSRSSTLVWCADVYAR